jgi:tRNA-dihydrouridine synthase C
VAFWAGAHSTGSAVFSGAFRGVGKPRRKGWTIPGSTQRGPLGPETPVRIYLAPMEGLLDFTLRDVLTRAGGVDLCVSEFIRVTDRLLPRKTFLRVVPELAQGARTPAGVPVRAQLLGSDPVCMAENAARLAELGPAGIDLNFGCPAKVVNRHGGGALLLKTPQAVEDIVSAVRRAVPAQMPVSAKMRLGYHDDRLAEECALAIQAGGASELTVHGRTRDQGYRPPAYWGRIADLRALLRIPVVANGEIWTPQDAQRCLAESGCEHLMLGRGMVANPGLALLIREALAVAAEPAQAWPQRHEAGTPMAWAQWEPLLALFWSLVCRWIEPRHRGGRLKQWLHHLKRTHPEAQAAYERVRCLAHSQDIEKAFWGVQGPAIFPSSPWLLAYSDPLGGDTGHERIEYRDSGPGADGFPGLARTADGR